MSTDEKVDIVLKMADKIGGIYVAFHMEPYEDRTLLDIREDIIYIFERYSSYKSFYRNPSSNRPIFYCYDSYHINMDDWRSLLTSNGNYTIRNTKYDADYIALILNRNEASEISRGEYFLFIIILL